MSNRALVDLEKFHAESANWVVIADLVRDVLRRGLWADAYSSPTEWLSKAATASGYTAGSLRRLVKNRDFLDRIIGEEAVSKAKDKNIPVSYIEVLKRMFDVSPDRARELFDITLLGGITYRKLLEEYDTQIKNQLGTTNASKLGHRLSRNFNDNVFNSFIRNIPIFTDKSVYRVIRDYNGSRLSRVNAIGFEYSDNEVIFVDGFIFQMTKTEHSSFLMRRLLEHLSFHAGFYRKLWIIFPHESGLEIPKKLCEDLLMLERYSIGVVTISIDRDPSIGGSPFEIILKPSGPPVPDWQRLFIDELPENIIGE